MFELRKTFYDFKSQLQKQDEFPNDDVNDQLSILFRILRYEIPVYYLNVGSDFYNSRDKLDAIFKNNNKRFFDTNTVFLYEQFKLIGKFYNTHEEQELNLQTI